MLLGLVACWGGNPDSLQHSVRRVPINIVNGQPSPASQDAVVMINIVSQQSLCTGTLLAPNLVLTARHCVSNIDESTDCGTFTSDFSPQDLQISVGANADMNNPVAGGKQLFHDADTSGCGHDIALILLDGDVPNALTAPVPQTKTTVGEASTAIGYGEDGSGNLTPGRYYRDGLKVLSVGPDMYTYKTQDGQSLPVMVPAAEIVTGESTCFGDSGGPLLAADGSVIGVTSRGIDNSCIDRPSIYSDVFSHLDLIGMAMTAAGHPLPPPPPPPPGEDAGGGGGGSDAGRPPKGDGGKPSGGGGGSGGDDQGGDDFGGDDGGDLSPGVPAVDAGDNASPTSSSHGGCSTAPADGTSPGGAGIVAFVAWAVIRRRRSLAPETRGREER